MTPLRQDGRARRRLGRAAEGARPPRPPRHGRPATLRGDRVSAGRVRGLGPRAGGRRARAAPASTAPAPTPASTSSSSSTRPSTTGRRSTGSTRTTACASRSWPAPRSSTSGAAASGRASSTPTTGRPAWCPSTSRRSTGTTRRSHRVPSVFTIHNVAYQGQFGTDTLGLLGLPWNLGTADALEYHGAISYLKGGDVFAELVNTVSPTYALEIQGPEHGFGFDGVVRSRAADVVRDPERRRLRRVGPAGRPAPRADATRPRTSRARPPARPTCCGRSGCRSSRACRWSA